MKHKLVMSMEKLVLEQKKMSKRNEKGYKHIKLGFLALVFGAVSAILCIDYKTYWSYLLLSNWFSLIAFFTCWAVNGLTELKPQVILTWSS